MARGRKKTQSYESKTYTGTFHWSEAQDWKFITVVGERCPNLFSVPFDALQDAGIQRVEFEDTIEIFVQRQEYTFWRGKQTKVNYDNYQIILLDFDFLFEWQSRFFGMLGWDEASIRKFLSEDTLEYIARRTSYFKAKETERYAELLAEQLGSTKELILKHLLKEESSKEEPIASENKDDSLSGVLRKIGQEYFIDDVALDDGLTVRYKVSREIFSEWLGFKYLAPNEHLNTDVGKRFKFTADPDKKPPKSRGAVGWVSSLCLVEEE